MVSRTVVPALALIAGLAIPLSAQAQSRFTFTPSFTASAVYDDNLFSSVDEPLEETYLRFTPGIHLTYRSTRTLTLNAGYSFEAERFPERPEFDDTFARQRAAAGFTHRLTSRSTWSLSAGYVNSRTRRDLVEDIGADFRPGRAESLNGSLSFNRRLTASDTLTLGYAFQGFAFGEDNETSKSHLPTLGWIHDFTRQTSLTARIGPRYIEGNARADFSTGIRRTTRRGAMSLSYRHGSSPIPTEAKAVNSDILNGNISYLLGRSFDVSVAPGVSRLERDDAVTWVYRIFVSARYGIGSWFGLQAQYQGRYEQGDLSLESGTSTDEQEDFFHNIFLFGITVGYPFGRKSSRQ